MMKMSDGEEIYEKIGEAAYGFFKTFLKEKKDSISKFFVKYKVGFLPQGMDYSVFQSIKRRTSFKQLKFLIGNHKTLPIVMTGLWIKSLSEDERLKVVSDNRNEIYEKYKEEGVNILNMGTTGFMEGFIKFLTSYNIKRNPSKEEIIGIYESTLKEWAKITIFVKKDSSVSYILSKCNSKITNEFRFFYVFASYSARKIASEVIDKLIKKNILKEANYEVFIEKLNQDGSRKAWIFEKQDIL